MAPNTLRSQLLRQRSSSISVSVPRGMPPALLTRMSIAPQAAASFLTCALSVRSAAWVVARTWYRARISAATLSSSVAVRAARWTWQPSAASALAMARPMPFDPPVISAERPRRFRSTAVSRDEGAAELLVDMGANDLLERALRLEAELARAPRLDALRPARDNACDEIVVLAADAPRDPLAGDALERRDLLRHRAAHARHRETDARSERVARQRRRVQEEPHRGARAGVRVHDRLGDRQYRLLAGERLANDAGEEARGCLVRLARPHHDGGEADADAIAEAASGVVGEQRLADRFLGAVGGERREMEVVGDRRGKRRPEHRDRGRVDEPGPIAVAGRADRLEQCAHAVEIDPIALVEVELGFARDHAGEMEDHVGTETDELLSFTRRCQIACKNIEFGNWLSPGFERFSWKAYNVLKRQLSDCLLVEPTIANKPVDELTADHAGRAGDENVHLNPHPTVSRRSIRPSSRVASHSRRNYPARASARRPPCARAIRCRASRNRRCRGCGPWRSYAGAGCPRTRSHSARPPGATAR